MTYLYHMSRHERKIPHVYGTNTPCVCFTKMHNFNQLLTQQATVIIQSLISSYHTKEKNWTTTINNNQSHDHSMSWMRPSVYCCLILTIGKGNYHFDWFLCQFMCKTPTHITFPWHRTSVWMFSSILLSGGFQEYINFHFVCGHMAYPKCILHCCS